MSVNKVILIGNVGKDPDVRYLDSGIAVATFSLATTERGYTLQNGTQVPDRTEWHNIVLWRGLAQTAEKYVRTGECTYIRKRTGNDIWKNLYEPLLIETESPLDGSDEAFIGKLQGVLKSTADVFLRPVKLGVKHVLSHRVIHANFYELVLPADLGSIEGYQKVSEEEIHKFAVSNLVYQFFSLILEPNNQKI